MNIKLLSKVPFVGLKSYSKTDNELNIKWYQEHPHGFGYRFFYPRCEE